MGNPYGKIEPCDNCPFRRSDKAVRVHPVRAKEIARSMLTTAGGEFICHKHLEKKDVHCAGALIFAEKNDTATQMMRVAERIGMYDRDKLLKSKSWDDIFDTIEEMIKANQST